MRARLASVAKKQSGAVLIVALVLLLILTVLGTSGIQDTLIAERMTGNFRDVALAFEAAESSLRTWEGRVGDNNFDFVTQVTGGDLIGYDVTDSTVSILPYDDASYATVAQLTLTIAVSSLSIQQQPTYYVERLPPVVVPGSSLVRGFQGSVLELVFYRITSKGFGVSPNAEVILQSSYFRGPE